MTKITIVSNGDDWEGLYVNGKCIVQDHRISRMDLIEEILKVVDKGSISVEECYLTDEYIEKAYNTGCFPDNLSEMELE